MCEVSLTFGGKILVYRSITDFRKDVINSVLLVLFWGKAVRDTHVLRLIVLLSITLIFLIGKVACIFPGCITTSSVLEK